MNAPKYFIKEKIPKKLLLSYYSTINYSFEINNKNPIFNLISNFSEVKNILEDNNSDKLKFLYFNRNKIHKILYEIDEIIKIDSYIINKNLSTFFYLILLIQGNKDIINYEYSLNFIKDIYNHYKNDNNNNNINIFKNITITKIIIELVRNYKGTKIYDEEKDKDELDKIENYYINKIKNNLNTINELGFELNENNIKKIKIDEIYIEIINKLIITNKIDDYKYTFNIINQLDLINIDITKKMFDELYKIINKANIFIKYLIINNNDLFDQNKINFYFIILKFILKNPIYIYQIPFFLKSRKNIIKIIKSYDVNNKISFVNEKFEYIFNFLTDSYNYNKYLIIFTKKREKTSSINISNESSLIVNENKSKDFLKQTLINQKGAVNGSTSFNEENNNNNNNNKNSYYYIIKFERIFEEKENAINAVNFIKEISNNYLITGGPEDNLYIYNKSLNLSKIINFKSEIEKKNLQTLNESGANIDLNEDKLSQNIIELNYNNIKNEYQIIDCSKRALMFYKLKLSLNSGIKDIIQIKLPSTVFFEIKKINNKTEYIVAGEKGLFHFDDFPFNLDDLSIEKLNNYKKINKPFLSGIKINDKYIALTSNSILIKGEDSLVIYDTEKKEFLKNEIKESFVEGIYGLNLMDFEENNKNYKILLCGCKKYISEQRNGIVIMNANLEENKELSYKFYDTNDFEVNCFCPIYIKEENNKMTKTNYFLVGGFDKSEKEGMIKLFEINYKNFNIEFKQDIPFTYKNENGFSKGFERNINCIIQLKSNGKILVSSWNGKIYLFSEPNIDFYLNDNDINIYLNK